MSNPHTLTSSSHHSHTHTRARITARGAHAPSPLAPRAAVLSFLPSRISSTLRTLLSLTTPHTPLNPHPVPLTDTPNWSGRWRAGVAAPPSPFPHPRRGPTTLAAANAQTATAGRVPAARTAATAPAAAPGPGPGPGSGNGTGGGARRGELEGSDGETRGRTHLIVFFSRRVLSKTKTLFPSSSPSLPFFSSLPPPPAHAQLPPRALPATPGCGLARRGKGAGRPGPGHPHRLRVQPVPEGRRARAL